MLVGDVGCTSASNNSWFFYKQIKNFNTIETLFFGGLKERIKNKTKHKNTKCKM